MKNKKGFTLIEVLGVLIILCIIFVLVFPNILNQFKKSEDAIDEATQKLIVDAAEDYMNQNYVVRQNNSVFCLELSSMVEQGLLKEEQVKDIDKYVKVNYQNDKYTFDLSDACVASASNMLILVGGKDVEINLNDTYNENGANAFDKDYIDKSADIVRTIYDINGKKVDSINTSSITKYVIEYAVDIDDNELKINRNVNVVDLQAPTITNESSVTNFTDEVSSFNLLNGITVYDNSGETITPTVTTDLSLKVPGTYKVTYTAIDSSGNKATLNRTLQIYVRNFSYSATVNTTTYAATGTQQCTGYGACCPGSSGCPYSCTMNSNCGSCQCNCNTSTSTCYPTATCCTSSGTVYSCPSGGTLSGTTCTKTTYTCPNGGTLNGTICEM